MTHLLLTGSRDQALLAMVIQEARRAADAQGNYVGRTALQKIMYFLKATQLPMEYQFDIHHYGPYCEEISRDVEWLMADEVIVDRSRDAAKYSDYAPGPTVQDLLAVHEREIEPLRERVREVVQALVPLSPRHLELIATLDYLYLMHRASGGNGPWKPTVLKRFHDIKGDKFTPQEVAQAYDSMVEVRLLTP